MAAGPAAAVDDWKTVDPGDWQAVARAKPYGPATRGAKLKGATDPNALGDSFVGTLATDAANAVNEVPLMAPRAIAAMQHPVDAITGLAHQLYNLPGETLQMLKDGKYGKLAARVVEAIGPGAATEGGAELASSAAAKISEAAAPLAEKAATVATAAKGATAGAVKATPFVGRVVKGAIEGAKGALEARTADGVIRAPGKGTEAPLGGGWINYGPEPPPEPPAPPPAGVPGFGVASGTTAAPPVAAPPRPAGPVPPVAGNLPGTAVAPAEAAVAAPVVTPGEAFAKAQGIAWDKLPPSEQAILEQVAKAHQNVAQQTPRVPQGPVQPPPPAAPPAAPPSQNGSLIDTLRAELEAESAAKRAAEPPAAQPLQGGHPAANVQPRGNAPLRPPLAQAPQSTPAPTTAPVAPSGPPANPSMAQAEAWMRQKAAAPPEEPRSMYTANGDVKSPQLRAEEIKGANATAKADRHAQAYFDEGITAEDVKNMTDVEAQQITNGLIAKGRLNPGETAPVTSKPLLIKALKKLQAADYAQKLADMLNGKE